MRYECSSCGSEMKDTDDKEFIKVLKEVGKMTRPDGFVRGIYRFANYWKGYLSKSVMRTKGYWYCPTCKMYRLECPNCTSFIELGHQYPVQGDAFTCGSCSETVVYYHENEDEQIDYPPDYGM